MAVRDHPLLGHGGGGREKQRQCRDDSDVLDFRLDVVTFCLSDDGAGVVVGVGTSWYTYSHTLLSLIALCR